MRNVTIAIAQLQGYWPETMSPDERSEANVVEFEKRLDEAGALGPDLIAVGECFNHNDVPNKRRDYSEDIRSGRCHELASTAARKHACHVAYGINGTLDGVPRNATVLLGRSGETIGTYSKVHLTQNEAEGGATPGDTFPVFATDFGTVGIMTCHDMSFPESARCLMLNGAELIVWPTMWSGWGDELTNTVIRARCIDNSVFLVMASTGQNPDAVNWVGGVKSLSAIYNPEGKIICQKADRLPGVLLGQIDLDFKRIAPWFTTDKDDHFLECVLAERRPETYGKIIDTDPAGACGHGTTV